MKFALVFDVPDAVDNIRVAKIAALQPFQLLTLLTLYGRDKFRILAKFDCGNLRALSEGVIRLSDDEGMVMDDHNICQIIAALDEIEPAPTETWWKGHYESCPGRSAAIAELQESFRKGQEKGIWAK